jgi:hypothetical protein
VIGLIVLSITKSHARVEPLILECGDERWSFFFRLPADPPSFLNVAEEEKSPQDGGLLL